MIAGHNPPRRREVGEPALVDPPRPGFVLNTPDHVVFVAYPLIPWVGVTALGYGLGRSTRGTPSGAGRGSCALGLGAVAWRSS